MSELNNITNQMHEADKNGSRHESIPKCKTLWKLIKMKTHNTKYMGPN